MDEDLDKLSAAQLVAEVKKLRTGIRAHRDSSGQELCWHHPQLWGLLPEPIAPEVAVPPWPKFLRGCVRYRESLDRELPEAPIADVELEERRAARASSEEALMLGNTDAIATVAVKNLDTARKFYEGTLGLKVVGSEGEEVLVFKSGASNVNVYKSQFAGTNQATALAWMVGARLDEVVKALKAKGVAFEHYDMPGVAREGDIHVCGKMRTAWFKDPDGNILNVMSE
jgi:catechol 2,3-dioxygenase-like lactoylglutathione lyase family enzyme